MATPDKLALATGGPGELACLLRKDLRVFILRDRILVFGIFFLASLQAVFLDEAFFWLGVGLAGALATYVPVIEWHQETDPMLHSLPVRRTAVVVARYLSALFAGVVAGISWISAGFLLRPLLDPGQTDPALWMTLDGIVTFGVVFGLAAVLFLPLYFRLGLGRGVTAFFPLCLTLFAGLFMLSGGAGGPETEASRGTVGLPGIPRPSSLIQTRVSDLMASLGPGWALALILTGLAVAFVLSAFLSARWLSSRDI